MRISPTCSNPSPPTVERTQLSKGYHHLYSHSSQKSGIVLDFLLLFLTSIFILSLVSIDSFSKCLSNLLCHLTTISLVLALILTLIIFHLDYCFIISHWPFMLSHSGMSDSLWPPGLYPAKLLCSWDSPSKNTGVGCHFLLQRIFLTQGSNPDLWLYRWILYCLGH